MHDSEFEMHRMYWDAWESADRFGLNCVVSVAINWRWKMHRRVRDAFRDIPTRSILGNRRQENRTLWYHIPVTPLLHRGNSFLLQPSIRRKWENDLKMEDRKGRRWWRKIAEWCYDANSHLISKNDKFLIFINFVTHSWHVLHSDQRKLSERKGWRESIYSTNSL